MNYTSITVIYNPNSTGSGRQLAEDFMAAFNGTPYEKIIKIIPTEHRGHAEELARELVRASARPLIISASGDGGYHEVVNGAMAAKAEGGRFVTGLLPAGNANDHYRSLHDKSIHEMIVSGEHQTIDLLQVSVTGPGGTWQRYAHSYVGVGLTPQVGRRLNQTKLNPITEKLVTLKALWQARPVRLVIDGRTAAYDSVITSNIASMSKVLQLSEDATPNDGQFEVMVVPHDSRWKLWAHLLRAATTGLTGSDRRRVFAFQTTQKTTIQLDGEVRHLLAGDRVTITLSPRALDCVL
jgi:diacylglycerol kinase (ATP)